MSDQPTRGKRVQIYLPADLIEKWEATPRYERSALVAEALRVFWGLKSTKKDDARGVRRGTVER